MCTCTPSMPRELHQSHAIFRGNELYRGGHSDMGDNKIFTPALIEARRNFYKFVNQCTIAELEEWSMAPIIRAGKSRKGVKTFFFFWITEHITKNFVILWGKLRKTWTDLVYNCIISRTRVHGTHLSSKYFKTHW